MISDRIASTLRCAWRVVIAVAILGLFQGASAAERLRLACQDASESGAVQAKVLRPVDVYLVAERSGELPQISAVAYTLEVPDGLLVIGEELLVESLLGLGSSTGGMNLLFQCVTAPSTRVLRFRIVATRPLQGAVLGLRADTRTKWLGLVACKDENFAKFDSPADSLLFSAR